MNLLEKIENLINLLLIKLTQLLVRMIPAPVKLLGKKLAERWDWLTQNFRKIPVLVKELALRLFITSKKILIKFNFKAALSETYQKSMAQVKLNSPKDMGKYKALFLTPFIMLSQWLNGLSAGQSILLLTFSSASFLAVIGIGFSGQKIMTNQLDAHRSPASSDEGIQYERPAYYKKQQRHLVVTNLRLPVYIAEVNEIRSVDIDFTATLSNRFSRNFLEKHEFHLRDHFILHMEPSVASFPLEREGHDIISDKIFDEINYFLQLNQVEGEVLEIKLTYILAN
jgi:flagellar basal body-associated protein FliL